MKSPPLATSLSMVELDMNLGLRLSMLIELGLDLAAQRDPHLLLDLACKAGQGIFSAQYAAVGIVNEAAERLIDYSARGFAGADAWFSALDTRTGILGTVLKEGKPRRLQGLAADAAASGLPAGHPPIDSLLVVPLHSAMRTYGWFYVANCLGGDSFGEADEQVAVTLAAKLALAYENLLLYDSMQRYAARLEVERHAHQISETRFRLATEVGTTLTYSLDRDLRCTWAHSSRTGFDQQALLGKTTFDLLTEETARMLTVLHRQVIETGTGLRRDTTICSLAQPLRQRHFQLAAEPLKDASGEVTGVVCAALDITERKGAEEKLRTSEAHFRLLASATFEGIAVTEQGRFIDANEQLLNMLGYRHEDLIGLPVVALLPAEDRKRVLSNLQHGCESHVEHVLVRKDGLRIQVEVHGQNIGMEAGALRIIALRDITGRKRDEEALRVAATAFESQEGIIITDPDGTILRVNRAFTKITGYATEDAVGEKMGLLKSGRHDAAFYAAMWDSIQRIGSWQGEVWNRRKNGEVYPEWLTITAVKDDTGDITHYVGTLTDITARKAAEDEIKHLAFYDPLTRLPNRRLLLDRLRQALAPGTRRECAGALLFIDLDNFKTLNDTLGHDIGDLLLQQVAQRLTNCVREGDTVARLGGDEFIVMLEDLSDNPLEAATQTETVGAKIIATLNQPYLLAGHRHHSTPSIGATLFNDHQYSVDELLKRADLAMYQAKAAGGNTLRYFDPEMQAVVTARAALDADLRQGLQQNQFLLYYQPQVDGGGHMTGAEALVRWRHPRRGLVSPLDFIPLAEETGLILPLGHWVLETACAQLARWAVVPDMSHLTVAVNVSARQFRHPDFVDQVMAVLDSSGANPQRLKLELTESLLLDNVDDTIAKMTTLKTTGVGFSLDDFGTGYSSLTYLKRLPLHQLKIDQSFVRNVLTDPNDAAIARTIVALAQSMGLGVIAEGVETEEQRDFLAHQGCCAFQGYLFGRPLPIDGFETLALGI